MPVHCMTLEAVQRRNDTFRQTLVGGRVELSAAVKELDARMRGRLIYRITIFDRFHTESDHSDGIVIFAGFTVFFEIHEEADGLVMVVGIYQ